MRAISALDNLLRNAMEAAVAAKDIEPSTRPQVTLEIQTAEREISFHVIDNGRGPPSQLSEHLGEAFYTTKPRGIGLGLAMARKSAELHGGRLEYHRDIHHTTFTLTFPRQPSAGRQP